MAIGITAVPNNDQAYFSLTATGLDVANSVTITRNNPDGSTSPVRGASQYAPGGASTLAFFDYEAPLDKTVSYTLTVDTTIRNKNPYFETDISDWFTVGGTIAWDGTVAHSGTHSLKFTGSGGNGNHAEANRVSVKAGQSYTVQGWVYTPNAYSTGGGIGVNINWYDTSGTYTATDSNFATTLAATWKFLQATFTAPADGFAGIAGQLAGQPPAGQVVYLDEMELIDPNGATVVSSSSSSKITTDGQTFWLKNVSQESLSRKITVSSMSNVVRAARTLATYSVLGRANPVVISDIRAGRAGTMTLTTNTVQDAADLRTLFSQGYALLFQAPASTNFSDMYFTSGDITESWVGVASSTTRTFDIPFVEVDSPTDSLVSVGQNSWLAVSKFATWQAVKDKRSTWLDVLNRPYNSGDAA